MNRPQKGEGFPGQRIVVLPRKLVATAQRHPLLAGIMPTDVGYFPQAQDHWRERARGASEAIFIYCVQGNGWVEMGGVRHPVAPNQLLVVPPQVPHAYGASESAPWSIYWFHATGALLGAYLEEFGVTVAQPVVPLGDHVQFFLLFEEVLDTLEHGFTMEHLLYAGHSLSHLLGVMLWQRQHALSAETDARAKIARSIEFMKAHLAEPLRVGRLAAVVNLSASHYATLFKRLTGYPPVDYLIRLRMQRAVQLLNTTQLCVKEIAVRVGYPDQFYFSRAFKQIHDHSPSVHRTRHGA